MLAAEDDPIRSRVVEALGAERADVLLAELEGHGLVVVDAEEYGDLQEVLLRYRRLEALVYDPDDDEQPD